MKAGAVFSDEEGDVGVQVDVLERADGRERKGIAVEGLDRLALERHPPDELLGNHDGLRECIWTPTGCRSGLPESILWKQMGSF
ncbi:hypothetical protein DB345_02590 [Spartobacteria bacterium LR76]|nr:hypothetical protein DB345_02590 [Spartobacteria bacterium LR76]